MPESAHKHGDAGAQGELHRPPDGQDDQLRNKGGNGVGHTPREDRAHTGLLALVRVILSQQAHDQGDVGGDRRHRVGGGVADAVDDGSQGGAVPQRIEHGDQDRRQNHPLGGTGGHEQVQGITEQRELALVRLTDYNKEYF